MTGSIATLQEEQQTLKNQQKAMQGTLARLEREIQELAKVGHPIYWSEEAAKLHSVHTAHILRMTNFGKLSPPEIERFLKTHIEKLPAIKEPTINVQPDHTQLIFHSIADANTFKHNFLINEPKPNLNGSPIYCRPELPSIVLATQRPLNQAKHAYRQSLPAGGKDAKVSIDWKKRVLYHDTQIIVIQKLDGSLGVDHLLDETLAAQLLTASQAKDYFKTFKAGKMARLARMARLAKGMAKGMAKASVNRKAPASARSPGARTFGTNHYDRVRPARPWRELGVPPEQS